MYPYLNIHPFTEQLFQAFSWMLVHSLWQGLLLAVVTASLLQLTKRAKAQLRYNIVFFQFVLFILACIWTFIHTLGGSSDTMVPLAGAIGQNASQLLNIDAVNVKLFADSCAGYISDNASLLVFVWAICFTFRSFRMVRGLIYLQKAKHRNTHAAAGWHEKLMILCSKLRIHHPVQLLESARVKVPMVIGHLKPVILMPAGLLAGLPVEQIEAVLLHELAHIRRNDYLVNLLQTICETVYFFNPGLLWISALLRDEREHCCDDIALGQTGNKKEFIQALISFKEHAMYNYSSAVAFPGKKNQLLQRVSRIINNKNQSLGTGEKVFFMAGIMLLTAILSTAAITQLRDIEHDIFNRKPAANGYTYTPPVKPQISAVMETAGTLPAMPIQRPAESRHQQAKDAGGTVAVIREPLAPQLSVPSATDLSNAPDKTSIADNDINPGPSVSERLSDESLFHRPDAPAYTPQLRRQANYRRPYTADRRSRLNTLTTSLSHADETLRQKALHDKAEQQREAAGLAQIQAEKDRQQYLRDKEQADRDRAQAEKDKQQAIRDREQAERDREQAVRDRMQADKDREQARRDRIQAEKDRQQAILDRIQADKDRAQADADKRRQTQFPVI